MSKQGSTCGDAEIRTGLRSWLQEQCVHETDTVVIEELGICRGQGRIDLAVVNGFLHGYEIKSDRDSLRRLEGQVNLYSKVLDRATVVVGARHLTEALNIVPAWWSVLLVKSGRGGPCFTIVRQGSTNSQTNPRSLVELLWLSEATSLLSQRNVVRGIRGKPRCVVWDRVCEHFQVHEIRAAVRVQLKARAGRQFLAQLQ